MWRFSASRCGRWPMRCRPAGSPTMTDRSGRFDDLRALFINCTLKRWPEVSNTQGLIDISARIMAADILVLAGPIWLGDNSSVMKQVHDRLYGGSHLLNDAGQYLYYGRVGGCLITGNEDGVKHCAQNVLYTLQHI